MDNDQVALGWELRAMEEEREPTPAEDMERCAHHAACLRVMGLLCFKEPDYASAVGEAGRQARENAARWMCCEDCGEWEEIDG